MVEPFVDIHCHVLPGMDDGASSWEESLEMAQMAVANGMSTLIATPHQGGVFSHVSSELILARIADLRRQLMAAAIPLCILPGADVRTAADLPARIVSGEAMTLGNHRRHVLLDLPHERYQSLDSLLEDLQPLGVTAILSHPERNQGLLKRRSLIEHLVNRGCLMQITSGSLLGTFGPTCQDLAVWMLSQGFVHFVATDAHGMHSRRPLLRRAYERLCEVVGRDEAAELCCRNPARVARGEDVTPGRRQVRSASRWFQWKAA
jgi:protein-tyrosine phosphatase